MTVEIAASAVVHESVIFEGSATVEAWCIVGAPSVGNDTPPTTVIGDGAVLRSHTVVYAGSVIGKNFVTGNKANIREACCIGDNVSVGTMAVVEHHVSLGHGVRLHSQSFVPEYCVLEDGVWLGPNAVLTNTRYPLSPEATTSPTPVRLCQGAIVGANATILPGVVVGRDSLVGAGSVVVEDVAEGTVVAGNPARFINEKAALPYGDREPS
ncbi:transferase [Pseudodesulfovibrio sp. JC047]|uniref:acyltransferase n=1 Tax=Pseudodesulfovibrio sp. JC047 TaxID=2683199 RepID=UPI0013D2C8AA|nr:acyltransferase [Pseudodesulfovibrio sp. JC047]NDV20652.1 transferase [Pseudodesulfovibrio sp. JC047]